MKLSQRLEGKRVRITDKDGEVFEGTVFCYIFPEDNEPEGIAEIDIEDCLQKPGQLIGFTELGVESIEVLDAIVED